MILDKNPHFNSAIILPSATRSSKPIECDLARTLTVSARCIYNASGTGSALINVYYSPDGKHIDTIAYTYWENTITAGAAVQRTQLIDPPEAGYLIFRVTNQDTVYNITRVKLWINVSRYWEDLHAAMSSYNATRR